MTALSMRAFFNDHVPIEDRFGYAFPHSSLKDAK